ncbi:hypothetical protein ACEPAI_6625 [Sanghuangporus weigelae]
MSDVNSGQCKDKSRILSQYYAGLLGKEQICRRRTYQPLLASIADKEIDALKNQQRQIPPVKDNEVLVKIHAVSLQYRDLIITNDKYPLASKDDFVPCSDCAGEVLACGSAVKGFKPGDRVLQTLLSTSYMATSNLRKQRASGLGALIDGVLTEYRAFPAHVLVKIPDYLTLEETSTLPCAAVTVYNGSDRNRFALQIARANGANVIAITSSVEKRQVLKELGATHIINNNNKETPKCDEEVLRLTNGRGVDHVVEVAGAGTILRSMNAVKMSSSIRSIGFLTRASTNGVSSRALIGPRKFENLNRLAFAPQQHVGKAIVKVAQN